MSTDEYVPSDQDMREDHVQDRANPDAGRRQWDAWLAAHDARVRRDAAREFVDRTLLDWGIGEDEDSHLCPATANDLRAAVDVAHPEETP